MHVLHIGNKNYSSWSLRPWVLLTTLGIPFTEAQHYFPDDGPSYPQFRKFSPTGFVPVLDDGDIKVWDTLAIVLHVAEQHPEVWPADAPARSWARSAAAEMHSSFGTLRNTCGMNVGIRTRPPVMTSALSRDIERLDELWTEGLTRFGGPYLAGEKFTAVDAFFCPIAFRAQTYSLPFRNKPYITRLLELPAMKAWADAALEETAREPGHEAETAGSHEVTEDMRAKA